MGEKEIFSNSHAFIFVGNGISRTYRFSSENSQGMLDSFGTHTRMVESNPGSDSFSEKPRQSPTSHNAIAYRRKADKAPKAESGPGRL